MAEGIFIGNAIIDGGKNYSIQTDVIANLPPAGTANRWFLSTDTNTLYWDNGTAWVPILNSPAGGSLTGADNGLSLSGTVVELGGPLIKATDIVTAGNVLSVNGGLAAGASTLIIDAQSILTRVNTFGNLYTIANVLPLIWKLSMRNGAPAQFDAAIISDTQTTFADQTGVYLLASRAALKIVSLVNAVATNFLQADASGIITNVALPISSANNALTVTANNLQLGGALVQTTHITTNGHLIDILPVGANPGGVLLLSPNGETVGFTNGTATTVIVFTDDNIQLVGSGIGQLALFTSALVQLNTLANAVATKFLQADATGIVTNVALPVSSANNGLTVNANVAQLGGSLIQATLINNGTQSFLINPAAGTANGQIALDTTHAFFGWQSAANQATGFLTNTNASVSAQIDAVAVMFLSTTVVRFSKLLNAVATRFLQADGSGNITNVALPVSTADNGLSVSSNAVELGGVLSKSTTIDTASQHFSLAPQVAGVRGGTLTLETFLSELGFINVAGSTTIIDVADGVITISIGGILQFHLDATRIEFPVLANTDATKFVQADNGGNLSNVKAFTSGAEATYTGTIVFTAGAAPSGTTTHTFSYSVVGNMVNLSVHLLYSVAGTAVTVIKATLPAGIPTPKIPNGWATNNTPLYDGRVAAIAGFGVLTLTGAGGSFIYFDGTNWQLDGVVNSGNYTGIIFQFTYFTS